jgi:transposase
MISFSGSLKIFLLVDCCDMRKGFNGLYGLVSNSFGEDPRSGALYVFCNRRHSRIKVLYFDGTGLWGIKNLQVIFRFQEERSYKPQ